MEIVSPPQKKRTQNILGINQKYELDLKTNEIQMREFYSVENYALLQKEVLMSKFQLSAV